jgi:chemotaxis signal transduction protein
MSTATHGCLLVRAGGRRLGLPLDVVVEVLELGELLPVPTREPALLGVVNQRGRLVPVFGLRELLAPRGPADVGTPGDTTATDPGSTLVLADVGGVRLGYIVDEAEVVMRSGMTFLPADDTLPWARAIVGLPDDGYVPLVDLALLRAGVEGI